MIISLTVYYLRLRVQRFKRFFICCFVNPLSQISKVYDKVKQGWGVNNIHWSTLALDSYKCRQQNIIGTLYPSLLISFSWFTTKTKLKKIFHLSAIETLTNKKILKGTYVKIVHRVFTRDPLGFSMLMVVCNCGGSHEGLPGSCYTINRNTWLTDPV